MDHPAEQFGKLFVEHVRDQAIASCDVTDVAKRFEDPKGDIGELTDLIIDQTIDVLIAFLTHEDHSFSNRGGEQVDGEWIDADWLRAVDHVEFRAEVESYLLHSSRETCRLQLNSPRRRSERWAQAIQDDEHSGSMAFIGCVVDSVAGLALLWIEPSYSRSFTWTENGRTHVLETLDDLHYQYFDGGWRETYSRYPLDWAK